MKMTLTCGLTYVKCTSPLDTVLLHISRETYRENYLYLWDDLAHSYMERFYSEENIISELEDPTVNFFLIHFEGNLAGYYKTKKISASNQDSPALKIDKLYLLKEFTGKALGKQVLQQIEEAAVMEGNKEVSLHVMDSSPAKGFYLKNGYQQTGKTLLSYPNMKQQYNVLLTLKKTLA